VHVKGNGAYSTTNISFVGSAEGTDPDILSPGRCSCSGKVQLVRRPVLGGLERRSTMDAPELRMTGNRPVAEV